MWRGGQDQKIRQANLMSNTKDKNEPKDAEAVPLSRIVLPVTAIFAAWMTAKERQTPSTLRRLNQNLSLGDAPDNLHN